MQKRWQGAGPRAVGSGRVGAGRVDDGAAAVGVGGAVERVEWRQQGAVPRVDQIDPAEVRWADGSHEKLITRADPRGGGGVFTSERDPEWRLLQALWKVDEVHIPRPRWYDAPPHAPTSARTRLIHRPRSNSAV